MKWLLCLIMILSSFPAVHADTVSEHDWWIRTYGAEIPKVSPLESLDELIASPGTEACAPVRKAILKGLSDYALQASSEKAGKAKGIADKVIKLLDYSGKTPCSEEGLKTYVLGSFFISYNDMIYESQVWLKDGGDHPFSFWLAQVRLLQNIEVEYRNVLALALLIHQNRLVLLTPAKRAELGGSWTTKEVFGAYDCETRTITIDPTLRPFDLGSTLEHEMDHLMRDLFFTADEIRNNFTSSATQEIDWNAYLTLDESIASIEASELQRQQINDTGAVEPDQSYFGKPIWKTIGIYQADNDFTFRTSKGPLEHLYQSGNQIDPVFDLLQIPHYGSNVSIAIISNGHNSLDDHRPAAFQGIFDLVHSSYFSGQAIDAPTQQLLVRYQPAALDPLVDWENFNATQQDLTDAMQGRNDLWNLPVDGDMMFDTLYREVELFKYHLSFESSGCALYDEAVQSGKVSGYAGLRFSDSRIGEQGSRPGENGSRPGETGSRPGETGSRPSLSVRPCLSLKDKL